MGNVGTISVKITGDNSGLGAAIKGSEKMLSGFGKGGVGMVAMGTLLANGFMMAGRAAIDAGKMMVGAISDSVDMASELNSVIGGTAAVWNITREQMQPVKDLINDLGIDPTLKVSSMEAAQAIDMLARNGLTMQQVLDGAARSTVLLANSTGGSFELSANVATDAMAMFKIQAKDMAQAVNGIVSVANVSKFGIEDYAYALAQGGGVAAASGVEFNDFNAAIAAISPSFKAGADAGTSLKVLLTTLVPKSKAAKEAMQEAGLITVDWAAAAKRLSNVLGHDVKPDVISVGKAFTEQQRVLGLTSKSAKENAAAWQIFLKGFEQNAFYDANGQLKDMTSIVGVLHEAFSGLSEMDRTKLTHDIFGTDAMRSVLALADMTEEEFRQLLDTMAETDATEQAATRMNDLAGDMEIFSGVLESVKIQIGDSFQPALRSLYQTGANVLSSLAPMLKQGADALASYIQAVANRVKSAFDTFNTAGGGTGGLLAALGTLANAQVSISAEKLISIDWSNFHIGFDPTQGITKIKWDDVFEFSKTTELGVTVKKFTWFDVFEFSKTEALGITVERKLSIGDLFSIAIDANNTISIKIAAQPEIKMDEQTWKSKLGAAGLMGMGIPVRLEPKMDAEKRTINWRELFSFDWSGWMNEVTTFKPRPLGLGDVFSADVLRPVNIILSVERLAWETVFAFGRNVSIGVSATLTAQSSWLADWLTSKAAEWNINAKIDTLLGWADVFDFTMSWTPSIATTLSWTDVFTFTMSWAPTIAAVLGWGDAFNFTMSWTPSIATILGWADVFGFELFWNPAILAKLDWSSVFDFALANWAPSIGTALTWANVFGFVLTGWAPSIGTQLTWANVFSFILTGWRPAIGSMLTWSSVFSFSLSGWAPSIGKLFSWGDVFSFTLDWSPTIHWPEPPGWLSSLFGGGGGGGGGKSSGGAVGRSSWSGGPIKVGEAGAEWVTLPRGSRIHSASESASMDNGGGVTVIIENFHGNSEIDLTELAYKIDELRRRRGR